MSGCDGPANDAILNHPLRAVKSERSLPDLINYSDPADIALSFLESFESEFEEITYGRLEDLSERLACNLLNDGIQKQIIPVILPQCLELYIAILGILKSGNAYCPILPSTTSERIQFICSDVNAPVIICKHTDLQLPRDIKVIELPFQLEETLRPRHLPQVRSSDLAYTMYTSGSTGKPKAVLISHSAASSSILAHEQIFAEKEGKDSFLQFANPTFDISVFEIFSAWSRGMRLISAKREILMTQLPELIQTAQIAYMELTPSMANLLPDQHDSRMRSVKKLITIGEMLTKRIVTNWAGRLVNAYGPTEATLHASYAVVNDTTFNPCNIGRALSTCTIVILNPDSNEILAEGLVGELCIAGHQIADGYLNRADLNVKAFVHHAELPGRLYRTGDLAHINNGEVYFVGRIHGDSQVKINGQRIELGEIAAAIENYEQVQACVVLMVEEVLFAFIVLAIADSQHGTYIKSIGPFPLDVRPRFIILPDLPTNASGKRDHYRLRELAQKRMKLDSSKSSVSDTALTDQEIEVLKSLRLVLSKDFQPTESFRDYGIDSLGAIKIVMQLRNQGLQTTVFDVLESDTVAELSERLSIDVVLPDQDVPLVYDHVHELKELYGDDCTFAPCSAIQAPMLAATISDKTHDLYVNHVILKFQGVIDPQHILQAWYTLCDIHEILRTGFHVATNNSLHDFIQIIHPRSSRLVPSTNINETALPFHVSEHKSSRPLSDLSSPAIGVQHFYTSSASYLSIIIHHALYDAWSLELMINELDTILHGNQNIFHPQYRTLISPLHEETRATACKRAYWSEQLKSYAAPSLPALVHVPMKDSPRVRSQRPCSYTLTDLDHLCTERHISPQVLGQLAWTRILSWLTGEANVCMALTTSGRTVPIPGIENTIGPFISTSPFCFDFSEHRTIRQAFESINKFNRQITKYHMAYRDILRCTHHTEGPDSLFIYQKTGANISASRKIEIIEQEDKLEFGVMLSFDRRPDQLFLQLDVDSDLMNTRVASKILDIVDSLISKLLTVPLDHGLQELQSLPRDLGSVRTTQALTTSYCRLDDLVAARSRVCPEDPALQFYDTLRHSLTLTYRELDQAAQKLASSLANEDLRPGDIIAVCLNKSIAMYASILAVLKLGCAYLALEPTLPDARIEVILGITKAKWIFTDHSSKSRFSGLKVIDAAVILQQAHEAQFVSRPSDGLAYVLMTSGTTGRPKACSVTHSNVLVNCNVLSTIYPHSPTDRMMQFTSFSFDVSVFEIFFSWFNGMCLVSAPKDLVLSNMTKAFQDFHVTHLSMTPSAGALIKAKDLPEVKCFVTAGEMTNQAIIDDWARTGAYFNAYGPTETTNVCTVNHVQSDVIKPSSIGSLLAGSTGYVLGDDLKTLPVFSVGELYISGEQVIRGYLGDDTLTAKSFVQHPELGRIYRTGDIARFLDDGSISLSGRKDSQVKIRGHRIELEEISHLLRKIEDVSAGATLVIHDTLVSFVTTSDPEINPRDLSQRLFNLLAASLPDYMRPTDIVLLVNQPLPVTSTHKLDSGRLIKIYEERQGCIYRDARSVSSDQSTNSSDWSDISRKVAELMSSIADVPLDSIYPSTSIFQLGLDSISAIRLSAALKEQQIGEISVSNIMRQGTPAGIARALDSSVHDGPQVSDSSNTIGSDLFSLAEVELRRLRESIERDLALRSSDISELLPCTSLQEGILLETLRAKDVSYVNHTVLQISKDTDGARLRTACQDLLDHTPMLRTCFAYTSSQALPCVQVVLKDSEVVWYSYEESDFGLTFVTWKQKIEEELDLRRPPISFLDLSIGGSRYLIISLHHALFDGWSLNLVLEDLHDLYSQKALADSPNHRSIITAAYNASDMSEGCKRFWASHLESYKPFSFPTLTNTTNRSQCVFTQAFTSPFHKLNSFSNRESRSLLSTLQAIWSLILGNIGDRSDLCFATATSGRTLQVEGAQVAPVPLFNVLPVRVRLHDQTDVLSLIAELFQLNVTMSAYTHSPLRKVVRCAKLDEGRSLFDTILILQQPKPVQEGSFFRRISDEGDNNYALMIEFIPEPSKDQLLVRLTGRHSIVSEESLKSLAQMMDLTLAKLTSSQPSQNLTVADVRSLQIPALTDQAIEDIPENALHVNFVHNANSYPNRIAIRYLDAAYNDSHLTYGELKAKVDAISAGLQALQLPKETPVVVMTSATPDLSFVFLAILQAGLTYAPLSTGTPEDRFEYIIQELEPGCILVDDPVQKARIQMRTIDLPDVLEISVLKTTETIFKTVNVSPQDLAYIIYTSGSTGKPKAVMVQHSAAVATIESSRSILSLSPDSKWLQFAAPTFDMSIYDMSVAFSFGICLCAAPRALLLEDLPRVVRLLEVTHVDLTPSVAKHLVPESVPTVKTLFCIGERLSQSIIERWGSSCINVYGPTEAAMACTSHQIQATSTSANIGKRFSHVQCGIFQLAIDQPVPILTAGELCVTGPQLSKGYLKDPAKTKSRFFDYNGIRFYRTGDLCRMLPNQDILYFDRLDNQVKLRGQRIELDEISFVMTRGLPDLDVTTLVMGSEDQDTEQLISFFARRGHMKQLCKIEEQDSEIIDQLTTNLSRALPNYMIPTQLIQISFMPLNAAQKVDRKLLTDLWKQHSSNRLRDREDDLVSFSQIELTLAKILSELSGVEVARMARTTSIYHLGLDSLSAIQIASALRKQGLELSVLDVLQNPTLEKLSAALEYQDTRPAISQRSTSSSGTIAAKLFDQLSSEVTKLCKSTVYLCTPPQENMIAQFIKTEGQFYYNHLLLKINLNVDLNKLRNSWLRVIRSHDILRCGFVAVDKKDCQYALVVHDSSISLQMWEHLRLPDAAPRFRERIANLTQQMLKDMSKPSLHLTHYETSRTEHYVLFSAHHAIYDGYSLAQIFSEVSDHYHGRDVSISDKTIDTARHIWSQYHEHNKQTQSIEYWRKRLANSESISFPNLNNREDSNSEYERQELTHSRNLFEIESRCRELGLSLSNVTMAIWAKLLSAYTGESNVTFGVVFSGRLDADLDETLFPCITTLPINLNVTGSALELVQELAGQINSALEYQHVSLSAIASEDKSALFDSLFVFQKQLEGKNSDLWQVECDIADAEIPISLEAIPDNGQNKLRFVLTHRTAKLPKPAAIMLLRQYEELFWTLLADPGQPIQDLELRLPSELLCILPPEVPELDSPVQLMHQFVQLNAEKTPEAIAFEYVDDLADESTTLTYSELEASSNRLAGHLIERHGLGSTKPIAICFDKCPEAFVSILAVLKTGSPFCCLDPTAPIDRKRYIIEDAEASAVLCGPSYQNELLQGCQTKIIVVDNLDKLSEFPMPIIIDQQDSALCYILYTSGSTGTPKGCKISHKSAVQALISFRTEFEGRYDSDSRFLAFASFHFDVSILESYFSWSVGARVCAAPKDIMLSDIPGTIQRFRITHLDLTPQLAMTLQREEAQSLRIFITGGEMLRAEIVEHWGDTSILFNFYGPTEATIGCTALKGVKKGARPSNIGQQWSNCGSIVQSQLGSPKPALRGAVGCLKISGNQVGEGYVNLEEATKKKFGYSKALNGRTYDTGDLVRLLEIDHSFDFVGRSDTQIKLRGQRIETGEIDSVIVKADSNIAECVTLVLRHPSQPKDQLVAFIVYRKDLKKSAPIVQQQSSDDLTIVFSACQKRLASYMIPSFVIPLNRIELTATNKVNTKKIKEVYESIDSAALRQYAQINHQPLDTAVDKAFLQRVKGILEDMTGVVPIEDYASVFELGLDSISVVALVRRLKSAGFASSTVSMVMTAETVLSLASMLSKLDDVAQGRTEANMESLKHFQDTHVESVSEQLELADSDIEAVLPVTPLVEGLLVESIQDGNNSHMNCWQVSCNAMDIDKALKAFQLLMEQTPVLRSRFVIASDGLAQVIVTTKARRNDTRSSDFPLKCRLVNLEHNAETNQLTFTIHHALYDGLSLSLIFSDFRKLYLDPEYQVARPTWNPAIADVLSIDIDKAQTFWRMLLAKSKTVSPRRQSQKLHSHRMCSSVDYEKLEGFANSQHCAPNVVLQTTWVLLMQHLFQCDSTFGLVVSGRNLPVEDIEQMAYPLFNTLSIYVDTSDYQNPSQLIKALQRIYGQAIEFEHTPLRDVKKWLAIPSDVKLVDTLLTYQKQSKCLEAESNQTLHFEELGEIQSGFALALDVTATEEVAAVFLQMNIADFGVDVKALCQHFDRLLTNLVDGQLKSLDTSAVLEKLTPPSVQIRYPGRLPESNNHTCEESLPESPVNSDLLTMISHIIHKPVREIGPSESFFSLGIDSIDTVRLVSGLKKKFQCAISVNDILDNNSVALLSRYLIGKTSVSESSRTSLIPQDFGLVCAQELKINKPYLEILPVSPSQEGILTMSLAHEGNLYLNHSLLRLRSDISIAKVEKAWSSMMNENNILRTSFYSDQGRSLPLGCKYLMVVLPKLEELSIQTQTVPQEELKTLYNSYKKRLIMKPINSHNVPIQLRLFLTENDKYLAIMMHHALYDGESLGMIYEDLRYLLNSEKSDSGSKTLHTSRPPFNLLIEHLLGNSSAKEDLFWSGYLKDCKPKLREAISSSQTDKAYLSSTITVKSIKESAKLLGVSVQSLAQAAFSVLMMDLLNETDVLFGTIQSGRTFTSDADAILGPCMNTVVIRSVIDQRSTYKSLAKDLHENNIAMSKFVHTPLRRVQGLIGKGPLFETLFVFQNNQNQEPSDNPAWEVVDEDSSVEFPLAVECNMKQNVIVWTVALHTGYLQSAAALAERIDSILRDITQEPSAAISVVDSDIFQSRSSPANESDISDDEVDGFTLVNSAEMRLADTLSEMIKIDIKKISRHSTIFELGLDSISVIDLSKRLKKKGLKISVGEILRNPSIRNMRRVIELRVEQSKRHGSERQTEAREHKALVISEAEHDRVALQLGIDRDEIKHLVPATASQIYFLVAWQALRGTRFMSNFVFTLSPAESLATVESRWHQFCKAHDILRTTFITTHDNQSILQCVMKTSRNSVRILSTDAMDNCASVSGYINSAEFKVPDLKEAPLSLIACTRPSGETTLILSIHHALYDAISHSRLVQWLQYGRTDETALTYSNFSRLVQNSASDAVLWWKTYLGGCKPFLLRPQNSLQKSSEEPMHEDIQHQTDLLYNGQGRSSKRLTQLSSKLAVTSQALLLAAIGKALADLSGSNDVILGMYTSGRSLEIEGIENVFGPTVNVVPIRLNEAKTRTLEALAKAAHEALIEINGFAQQVPMHKIFEATGWESCIGGLIDVAVNILPRRIINSSSTRNTDAAIIDGGRMTSTQIHSMRNRYATSFSTSNTIAQFSGHGCVVPTLDLEVEIVDDEVNFGVFCENETLSAEQAIQLADTTWESLMRMTRE